MLHHRHQLHMGIAHLLHIHSQLLRQLSVIVELTADYLFPVLVHLHRFPNPGTKMHLVDGHRAFFRLYPLPFIHPVLITPLILVDIPHNRSRVGPQLRIIPIRVRLQHRVPVLGLDFILVDLSLGQPRYKQLKNTGITHPPHLMSSAVPEVEISNYADSHGARRPHGKIDTLHIPDRHHMGAHLLVDVIMNSRFKLL